MAEFIWIGTEPSGDWYNADNWQRVGGGSGVPGMGDQATITSDARSLTITFSNGNPTVANLNLSALNGGTLNLSNLSRINRGSMEITAVGVGSTVLLPNLTELLDDSFDRSILRVRNGGSIRAERLQTLQDVDILSENSLLLLPALRIYRGDNNIEAISGGQIGLNQLETVRRRVLQVFVNGANSAVLFPSEASLDPDNYVVTIRNGGRFIASDDSNQINFAPLVFRRIAMQRATEDTVFSFIVPDQAFLELDPTDPLSYSATLTNGSPLPSWLSFNATTRQFSGTPLNANVGNLRIRLTATDRNGQGLSASTNFTLSVLNVNDPPTVVNPVQDLETTAGDSFTFTFATNTFADVDAGDTLTYTATLTNGNALPTWLRFNGNTRTFSGTPVAGDVGDLMIRLTASDRSGTSVSDNFTLTIEPENTPPFVNSPITDQNASQDTAFVLVVPANAFQDNDPGDVLSYSAQLENGSPLPSWLTFNANTRRFQGTPSATDAGIINITVTARDLDDATASDTFTLNINALPVVANPIADQATTEDQPFSLSIGANTFSDLNGDPLNVTVNAPSWLTFDPLTLTLSGTPTNANVGDVAIIVTATDPQGASIADTFVLSVANVNDAPVVANLILPQAANEGELFSFQFAENTIVDEDLGDSLSYTVTLADGSALPSWLSFDMATRTFNGTPTETDVGSFVILLTATDPQGAATGTVFGLTVNNVNDAPALVNPIGDQTNTVNLFYSYQVPETTFSDSDVGDSLSYTVTLADGSALPGWLSFDGATRTLSGTPSVGDVNSLTNSRAFEIRVTATDQAGTFISDAFTLKVFDSFNPLQYGASHPDLIRAFRGSSDILGAFTTHYINAGRFENRSPDSFKEFAYLVANEGIVDDVGLNSDGAASHYIGFGLEEGRNLGTFNPARYIAANDDLINAFGNNLAAGTEHFLALGRGEIARNERNPFTAFGPGNYIASHRDLIEVVNQVYGDTFGAHYDCVLEFSSRHFIEFSRGENRSRGSFNAQAYLNANLDLQMAFGNNLVAAIRHYIEFGFEEIEAGLRPSF